VAFCLYAPANGVTGLAGTPPWHAARNSNMHKTSGLLMCVTHAEHVVVVDCDGKFDVLRLLQVCAPVDTVAASILPAMPRLSMLCIKG
jgi:hypothetical protein